MEFLVLVGSLILGSSRLAQLQLFPTFVVLPACGVHSCLLEWSLILKLLLLLDWLKLHSRQLLPK